MGTSCARPEPASEDLFGGVARNYQFFEPLDFLAELVQHIPDEGEHLVRYYGYYSNKARGLHAKNAAVRPADPATLPAGDAPAQPVMAEPARLDRRRWAALIKHIYQADPLLCPKCGGTMKIIAFIEVRQGDTIRMVLEHCGLWHDPPPHAPPRPSPPSRPVRSLPASDPGTTHEVDPDFLEHLRREAIEQPEPLTRRAASPPVNAVAFASRQGQLPWEP